MTPKELYELRKQPKWHLVWPISFLCQSKYNFMEFRMERNNPKEYLTTHKGDIEVLKAMNFYSQGCSKILLKIITKVWTLKTLGERYSMVNYILIKGFYEPLMNDKA